MASLQAYLSLEASVATTMQGRWRKIAAELLQDLEPLLKAGKFADAHGRVNSLSLDGVVKHERNRIEELAVSSLLFGAHNCAGKLADTAFVKKTQPLPDALQHGVDQLIVIVEHDGAELIRKTLHELIRDQELLAKVVKADMAVQDLIDNGGMISSEETAPQRRSLYVHRPIIQTDELQEWAKAQGFESMLPPDDLHATVCYSKVPVDWNATQQDPLSLTVEGGKRQIKRFGDAIVLQFESAALQKRWQEFQDIGASWDHDQYRPHVTLSYDPNLDITDIEPFTGPLVFGGEVFQPIKNNWADDIDEVELRKAESSLADRLNDAVMGTGKAVIDLGANLTTSRLVTFGYLAEARERSITTYQVSEVLDDHTCPVCEYMHGKTFSVEEEYTRVLQALTTQNPQELKSIAPWPSQTKAGLRALNSMTLNEMQSNGYGSPPFHPGCRGVLLNEGTVEEKIALHRMPLVAEVPVEASKVRVLDPDAEDILTTNFKMKHRSEMRPSHQKLPGYVEDTKTDTPSLWKYTGSDYDPVNAYLRGQLKPGQITPEITKIVDDMDAMMQPTQMEFVTYRGLPGKFEEALGLDVGDSFDMPSFTSVSRSAEQASRFAHKGVVFQIRLPEGTPAIITNYSESEIILPRNRELRIVEKHTIPAPYENGPTVLLVAELV